MDDQDARRRKGLAGSPIRENKGGLPLYTVHHALGLDASPEHKYSIHTYLIFQRFDNMPSRNFDATMSFRTMYNDSRGMKTVDFSPASEDANPLFDKNGGNLRGVMVARRTFVCKIGWLKRTEEKERVYLKVQNCLPFPIRPEGMEDEKWEEVRSKGPESRTEWVLKAIEALREDMHWESLPIEKFKERHYEVKEVARKNGATIQAKCLDSIMYDVGLALYSKRK